MEDDTVWLTQAQITELFQRERTVITKHINNVFKENELDEKSNVQILHIANSDKPIKIYSLDVIISVGYRVKSPRGTQFRIWANKVLKDYMLKGYAPIEIKKCNTSHDRFLIIDENVYHVGASIKDLGKKLFAFMLMKDTTATKLLDVLFH